MRGRVLLSVFPPNLFISTRNADMVVFLDPKVFPDGQDKRSGTPDGFPAFRMESGDVEANLGVRFETAVASVEDEVWWGKGVPRGKPNATVIKALLKRRSFGSPYGEVPVMKIILGQVRCRFSLVSEYFQGKHPEYVIFFGLVLLNLLQILL